MSENELILIGDFIKENGIYYSNYTYKEDRKIYKKKKTPKQYKYIDYYEAMEEITPVNDDEVAITDEGEFYINYDYRKIRIFSNRLL